MSERELSSAEYKRWQDDAPLRVYFSEGVGCDGYGLDDGLRELGISWAEEQPFSDGMHSIKIYEDQLETVQTLMAEHGYWIFLASGPNGATIPSGEDQR